MRKETTVCPLCRFIHKIDASDMGREFKCANCNHVFVARTSGDLPEEYYRGIPNALQKIPEIREHLKGFEVIEYDEPKGDWVNHILKVKNPYGGKDMEIEVEDDGVFTLYFADMHEHFESYEGDFRDMINLVDNILSGKSCCMNVGSGKRDWLSSCMGLQIPPTEKQVAIRKGLQLSESFEDEINKTGGRVDLIYWNPAQSVFWIIEPKQREQKQETEQ